MEFVVTPREAMRLGHFSAIYISVFFTFMQLYFILFTCHCSIVLLIFVVHHYIRDFNVGVNDINKIISISRIQNINII